MPRDIGTGQALPAQQIDRNATMPEHKRRKIGRFGKIMEHDLLNAGTQRKKACFMHKRPPLPYAQDASLQLAGGGSGDQPKPGNDGQQHAEGEEARRRFHCQRYRTV